jgi:hypothetical protein
MKGHLVLILTVAVIGCADSGRATVDSGSRDSGTSDTSVPDTGTSDTGTVDTGTVDTGAPDTGTVDTGMGDGGGGDIVVDGVIGAGEWSGAAEATNGETSTWGATNTFTRILATVQGGTLFLAVEGQLESGAENALAVYVDNERGSGSGVTDPIDLTDGTGALDNSLSAGITTPADVQVDFAWGTRDLDRSQDGFDDRMGWRDVASDPGDFAWLDASEAPTVCGAAACETSIPLASLGGAGDIALFGRLVNTDGTMTSNQCVPEDDPDTPAAVTMLLTVTR